MKISALATALLLASAFGTSAWAVPATITETGTMSGSLNGTNFTNAAVTFTELADTSNQMSTAQTIGNVSAPYNYIPGTITVSIAGFSLATLNGGDVFAAASQQIPLNSPVAAGDVFDGIVDVTNGRGLLLDYYPGTYVDLLSNYTSTATGDTLLFGNQGFSYSTDLGTLAITGVSGNATFTEVLGNQQQTPGPNTVPEPTSLVLLGSGVAGLVAARRRTRRGLILRR